MPILVEANSPRPSSTVVVARAAAGSPEIFMVQRHALASFGSAYAFPGGVVEPDDSAVHDFCGEFAAVDANLRLGIGDGGLDYYIAAVRELFEESGILLANFASIDEDLSAVRDNLNDGSLSWADFVQRNKLTLYCESLHYVRSLGYAAIGT